MPNTTILKSKDPAANNETMIDNVMDFVSGDQLPSFMAALQFHLDLAKEYELLPVSEERYKYGKLIQCYKKGQLRQNLSHKLTIADIQPTKIPSAKKVKFSTSNLLHCYPNTTKNHPQLLRADDVTMSISANCSLKETRCRAKQT